jgi:hypothetical protein
MTNAELFAALERWAVANYGPYTHVEHVSLRLRGLVDPVALPVVCAGSITPVAPEQATEERGRTISSIVTDILRVLEEVGKPMTQTRILSEMAKRNLEWSQRSVGGYLARMVEDGTLTNQACEAKRLPPARVG